MIPRRRHLYVIDLEPRVGTKPGKQHPCLAIRPTEFGEAGLDSTGVLPLTTKLAADDPFPLRVRIPISHRWWRPPTCGTSITRPKRRWNLPFSESAPGSPGHSPADPDGPSATGLSSFKYVTLGAGFGPKWIHANPEALVNAAVTGVFTPTARWDYWSQPREQRLASEKERPLYQGSRPMVD